MLKRQRWLLYVNAYDDTSAKSSVRGGDKLPSPGAGWLGRLGLIYAVGDNLFETLMLNLILLKDGVKLWGENRPVWEKSVPKADERTEIDLPDNQAELLTLQSRRLIIDRKGDSVTGFHLLGGDFFDKVGAFVEQMTVWIGVKEKKTSPVVFQPKRHNPAIQLWREFSVIAAKNEGRHRPGIVSWIGVLKDADIIPNSRIIKMAIRHHM